jgi:hypothetical protein
MASKCPLIITRIGYNMDMLPCAHTCSTTIDLPDYNNIDILRKKLVIAITEGREGLLVY